MNVLIVGSGGREHALAWQVAKSAQVDMVFVAPGNGGTALEAKVENIDIAATDIDSLIKFCQDKQVELTIIGPEAPLAEGIVDRFSEHNLPCFGPSQGAAQLESSKAYSKAFMARHQIPTATYGEFSDAEHAKAYVEQQGTPIVIKADGLAAGKGVIIAQDQQQAFEAIDDMLQDAKFGQAGHRVVIEEFLQGEEASFMVMVDGEHVLPLATSQDHKARDNGDKGPNTGGMGAYSPAPVMTAELEQQVMERIVYPTVYGMASEGHKYTGFLYVGLMISPDGKAKVLEYNCRMGDPETQPILFRLESDLSELCLAAIAGQLHNTTAKWSSQVALGVVLCAGGYPNSYAKGDVINGLDQSLAQPLAKDSKVFHAGTKQQDEQIVTCGGRVLCVTCLADNVTAAQQKAYEVLKGIKWKDMYYRTDIGYRAVARETVVDLDR